MTEAFHQLNKEMGRILEEHGAIYPENTRSPRVEIRRIQKDISILDTPISPTLTLLACLKISNGEKKPDASQAAPLPTFSHSLNNFKVN